MTNGRIKAAYVVKSRTRTKFNLNHATVAELDRIPFIGPGWATRIIEYRKRNQGFKNIDELIAGVGMPEGVFKKMHDWVAI